MDVRQHKAERAHGVCIRRPRVKHLVDGAYELFGEIPFVEQLLNLFGLALGWLVFWLFRRICGILCWPKTPSVRQLHCLELRIAPGILPVGRRMDWMIWNGR